MDSELTAVENDIGRLHILVFIGTRPEAIKLAPVIQAASRRQGIVCDVAVTGQHPVPMLGLQRNFQIIPDLDLGLFKAGQSLDQVLARVVEASARAIERLKPDAVVVQGDTTSTVAVALASFYAKVPTVHVEAGLRTNDVGNPFPEEMNRRLTTRLTRLHLAPTALARQNLVSEAVSSTDIVVTGNTVIDALISTASRTDVECPAAVEEVISSRRPILLVTAHRRESWGSALRDLGALLARVATRNPSWSVIFPVHPNPQVRADVVTGLQYEPNVLLIDPLEYAQFVRLLKFSRIVLTDSGGIQEEAPSLGKPVLVFRDTTERPEGVSAGTARLVGRTAQDIEAAIQSLIDDPAAYASMAKAVNPYGDGRAAERVVEAMLWKFKGRPRPADFGI